MNEARSREKFMKERGWTESEIDIFIKSFVEGSEWSIESAYHQPSDKPIEGEMILCEAKGFPMIAGPNHENFNETVEHLGITRWAYTKDIMPGVVPSSEKKDVNPKFRKGDLVVLKSYQKCIELNKDWSLNEAALKGLMSRKFKIEDIEIENGQVFYKLDGGTSAINRFPECFLDYVGNLLQVPKMNAVNPKYEKGQSVLIKTEADLRLIFGKDVDLTDFIPYCGAEVVIDEVIKAGAFIRYKVRQYHGTAILVPEDVILCDANDRPQREPLECRNEIDSIIARDIHVAQLDTSKLNPSPMQIWNEMFSGAKGFLPSASPALRAFAAGQLLGLSEMIMKEMTDKKSNANE